jgi:hypothetical protein
MYRSPETEQRLSTVSSKWSVKKHKTAIFVASSRFFKCAGNALFLKEISAFPATALNSETFSAAPGGFGRCLLKSAAGRRQILLNLSTRLAKSSFPPLKIQDSFVEIFLAEVGPADVGEVQFGIC